jgi:hypothetical protein
MSVAGDAVVAMARSQIGVTENPPYSSNVPYWDWWGSPAAGAWCAVFGSWAAYHAGYPLCAVDGWGGFTFCPNGTSHSYPTGEALPTANLYPGCHVIYSWYGWGFENGVPVINDGSEFHGWIAGDHWGIATSTVDADGWFTAVEGNTSPTSSGSQDNGGGVWEKWRHIGDVCGWYEPPSYGDNPLNEELFTVSQYDDIMGKLASVEAQMITRTDWILKACHKCRMVEHAGAWWLTDFIGVTPIPSPDAVVTLQQLGYLDNDLDAAGNPIAQGCPDSVFDTLVRYDLVATDQAANG